MIRNNAALPAANRKYKDSVFRMVFSEKPALMHLYNALSGQSCTNPDELEINTLENAIYLGRKNDLSFVIQNQLYLYEHQSTVNPNLPLRNLFYISALYTKLTRNDNLFGKIRIRVPRPHFVAFYNGRDPQPERWVLRLSDSYERVAPVNSRKRYPIPGLDPKVPELELQTLMININPGYNEELKDACRELREYTFYVEKMRNYAQTMPLEMAAEKTVTECIAEGILADFLVRCRAEVIEMTIFEYDQEEHMRMIARDERKAGRAEGKAEGKVEGKATSLLLILTHKGWNDEALCARIQAEQNLKTLDDWTMLALDTESLEDFVNRM